MRFADAERVADAVLYEGYILYPYRASSLKNQFRWQFGIIAPDGSPDPSFAQSECLVEPGPEARLTIKLRFLQSQVRRVEVLDGTWSPVDRIIVDDRELVTWEEAVPHEILMPSLSLDALRTAQRFSFEIPGGSNTEAVDSADRGSAARIVRESQSLSFTVHTATAPCGALLRLMVRVEHGLVWSPPAPPDRTELTSRSLLGCHALLGLEGAAFLSLPAAGPEAAAPAREGETRHGGPVLAGPEGARDLMLCAPIVLPDYPSVAPESQGDFCDATEIDAMLTLRVLTLTDAERREAAATDPRARAILDRAARAAAHPMEELGLLGAVRRFADSAVMIGAVRIGPGDRVRLAPRRGADAADMFLAGRVATVAEVRWDLEDRVYLAVTLDDDPGADLQRAIGRYWYFAPDDVVPVDEGS